MKAKTVGIDTAMPQKQIRGAEKLITYSSKKTII